MDDTPPKRGRGRPPKAPADKAPKKRGTSGKHTPAPPERVEHLRRILRIVDPLDAMGDKAAATVARILGIQSGTLTMILRGERTASDAKIKGWEAAVREWAAARSPDSK
jgi:hypothetical protein